MPPAFAWVDFDESSRRKMLDIIEKFRDQDTVDELGIGTIRDAFSNYFFPGTSTIQTRARYFLFIPWIYLKLEHKKTPSSKIAREAREVELNLIDGLIKAGAGENEGVIGKIAGRKLQRLPSNIYWVGLYQWGIRRFPGTQDQYHRYLDRYYLQKSNRLITDDREPVDEHQASNWDPDIPERPHEFPRDAVMDLTREEAEYLQERILNSHGKSLLAVMINTQHFVHTDYFWKDKTLMEGIPSPLKENLNHAHYFAQTIYGAVLVYNLMLSQAKKNEDLSEKYKESLKVWSQDIKSDWDTLSKWSFPIGKFWECEALCNANIPESTKKFVESWCKLVYEDALPDRIVESNEVRNLIVDRELRLKRKRARLINNHNRYLDLWNGSQVIGMLDYRWKQAKRIIQDIRKGIGLEV